MDFVDKSRSFSIVLRRVQIILSGVRGRTSAGDEEGAGAVAEADRIVVGALTLDRKAGRAFWNDAQVPLTLTEYQLVDELASKPGRDIKYRDLYNLVHGENFFVGTPWRRVSGERPQLREADPAEVQGHGSVLRADRELSGLRLPLARAGIGDR